ncbi:U3-containing 90S pre-ribosomal complex subunit-domain containing protein [Pilobolus umbonatus]|nr:U3-containing 90S pre-ribosomal complex subunit-domain containing protein [Pilobolus umbonatus]
MSEQKKKITSADDFEDDFQEEEIVYSDTEPAIEAEVEESVKRPLETTTEEPPKKKKKKQNKKKKLSSPFDTVNIWEENQTIQAEYIIDRLKLALPDLTQVEVDERRVPETSIVNNSKFQHEHTLSCLSKYIKFGVAGHRKLAKKPTVLASPLVLVVTHSAVRAVELARALQEFATTAKVAKLFAKHFKIEEQIDYLERQSLHIGVGTPNRLLALIEQDHLKLDLLELVVIDTERNAKKFNIFDIQEVRTDLFNFLGSRLLERLKDSSTKIGLF